MTIIILTISLLLVGFLYWRGTIFKKEIKKREEEIKHQIYELAILKGINDRVGYSLNLKKIVDVITGSLSQFIEFSTASYMLLESDRIVFKTEIDEAVSKGFIIEVKNRMMNALSILLNKDISETEIENIVTGVITSEDKNTAVKSFFNIPLVIDGIVLGVLTIAHTKEGLYKEKEMTLLYKIVAQATHAVEQLEEVINTEQGKLDAMVESMADGVVMTDNDYRVIVANPAAKKIIDFKNIGDVTIFDFIDRFSGKFDIRGKLEESVKMGKVFVIDDILIGETVFQIFVSPVMRSVSSKKEKILGGLVILHNITRIKEAEKMREEFASMIVHELRSPLDGIKKMGEFMRSNSSVREDEKTYDEYMRMIYESSSEMLELVSDLLDVSKIESGKFSIRKVPSDIKKIINERIKFFETTARDSKIDLSASFDSKVPNKVDIDPIRISQVLNNLISNALKFTNSGGRVAIQLLVHEKGKSAYSEANDTGIDWFIKKDDIENLDRSVIVAVTDTGPGISKNDIDKLFNKFIQFEAAARSKKRGTGLGLVVVKGIIKAHDGVLGVASEEGKGSTFYFTIKL